MNRAALEELADSLCSVFLGWRLREDFDALVALGEGALRVDLRSAEAWCDGDPIPPLFMAGELRSLLEKGLEDAGLQASRLEDAQLDAEFAARERRVRGRDLPALDIACRVRLVLGGEEFTAQRSTGEASA